MSLILEKIKQASSLLEELDIDLWLIFARETDMLADPALNLVVGREVTWQSFFLFHRSGQSIALVGNFDRPDFEKSGHFDRVLSYTAGIKQDFLKVIGELDPKSIAINYSTSNPAADGLTHGMYLLLGEYLAGTLYSDRLSSAEKLQTRLRSVKTSEELNRLRKAAVLANDIWHKVAPTIELGQTEIEVAEKIERAISEVGGVPSFETIVNAGDKTEAGHVRPTSAKLDPGDLLHVDFGVKIDGYCSDIQRLLYFNRRNESTPPPELIEAFETVGNIIIETGQICRPGVKGYEVDDLARRILTENGYPEYQHALGHQLGRNVHDGGALIGPKWERYGSTPTIPLEKNNVFTLELEIILPGIGCVGLEEDMVITERGAEFLAPTQKELIVK